jgi:hypothetical protein
MDQQMHSNGIEYERLFDGTKSAAQTITPSRLKNSTSFNMYVIDW